jgi:NhaA family Na+:H+ antiporter
VPAPSLADRLAAPLRRFLAIQAASTILLLAATALALAWANSPWGESYARFWHTKLSIGVGSHVLALSLEHCVNDGLMVLFFFLVGLEIKHELVHGELASRARAMLPLFGALGGMLVPAAIYASLHAGGPAASGWGVPMATDIAFAVAALAVLGPRVPSGLKVFLLALAIVDDLGAVSVIALFYSHDLSTTALGLAGLGLLATFGLRRAGVRSYPVYWAMGLGVWLATLASGIHATVAGVALGLLTPSRPLGAHDGWVDRVRGFAEEILAGVGEHRMHAERKRVLGGLAALEREGLAPLEYLTARLHPWVAFGVMPVFALANAGVVLEGAVLADPLALRVSTAVALGLLVGKPLGITLFAWLAVRLGLAALPGGTGWGAIFGAGVLGGIGFTMALFITALAFADPGFAAASKVGVMAASVLATAGGLAVLVRVLPSAEPAPKVADAGFAPD